MTRRDQESCGARLNLPRDLQLAYCLGRFGAATMRQLWPLFFGSYHTARRGFGRLVKLGLIKSFDRHAPSDPKWFSLSRAGLEWVLGEAACAEDELRTVTGLKRLNLAALDERNLFWASLVVAARQSPLVKLALFRPEWELRRLAAQAIPVVPDAMLVLERRDLSASIAWMVEQDSGSERSQVWRGKAQAMRELRAGALYGAADWLVVATVPSVRRAKTIAEAVTAEGAGAFIYLAVAEQLWQGRAFERVLWSAQELARSRDAPAVHSLLDPLLAADPDQQLRSTVDQGLNSRSSTEAGSI